ncbi:hypothetical protein VKT23_008289 [Stygiomarasmius scandens]|uniref:Heterokaryon incompatibility domain-containing protein n=1 Tax=Marasmiellus scandens TaxID=2682957 RepID=A0ABR1JKA7_9AGAR
MRDSRNLLKENLDKGKSKSPESRQAWSLSRMSIKAESSRKESERETGNTIFEHSGSTSAAFKPKSSKSTNGVYPDIHSNRGLMLDKHPEPNDSRTCSPRPEKSRFDMTTIPRKINTSLTTSLRKAKSNRHESDTLQTLDLPRRLINTYTYELVDFANEKSVPEYAIISHRWREGEEVGFAEFTTRALDKNKPNACPSGYTKIMKACEQARRDEISWIWIDTSCIDQDNHEDVARSIKSMYAYYRNARVCYAWLHDVSASLTPSTTWNVVEGINSGGLKAEVEESEWFSRGWTLQELLAPKEVIFFDRNWEEVGRRSVLTDVISLRTGIPEPVLEGIVPLQDVDMVKKLCWSVNRQTSKPEDQAYCLLGILGVSMEPCYGEGVQKAFDRLTKVLIEKYPGCWKVLDGVGDLYSMLKTWSLTSRVMVDELDFDSDYSSDCQGSTRTFCAGRLYKQSIQHSTTLSSRASPPTHVNLPNAPSSDISRMIDDELELESTFSDSSTGIRSSGSGSSSSSFRSRSFTPTLLPPGLESYRDYFELDGS